MVPQSALTTLIELAVRDSDEAAKRLGQAISFSDESESKLALLMQYRDDYAARFQSSQAAGLTAMEYRNFQIFLEKLDSAIAGQQQILIDAQKRVNEKRIAWQACERKRLSYDTLASRAQKEEQRKETKRDQKLTDEHAARASQFKR